MRKSCIGRMPQVWSCLALAVAFCRLLTVDSFVAVPTSNRHGHERARFVSVRTRTTGGGASALAASTSTSSKATLTESTIWKLRFVLKGVSTLQGKKVDEIFSVTAKFLEEEGYEPPQGVLQPIDIASSEQAGRLQITKSYWKLSEDPNDRKDGLWIWGLFKEPLYPFLLLQLETAAVPMSGGNSQTGNIDADSILPLQLYAQINHKRDDQTGVVLEGADLNVRQMETIKADPFGGAMVEIFEEKNVGTLSIQLLETNAPE